jgi:hypothetical protein
MSGGLLEAVHDAPEVFYFMEEAFDEISLNVEREAAMNLV